MCDTPFMLKNTNTGVSVPCGKCPTCKARRASAWSFRLMQEEKVSTSAIFLTLTYDTSNVPITSKGYMSLRKSDLQKFFKLLRYYSTNKIRYYAVGEYGGKTMRPHYHIILFNANYEHIGKSWKMGSWHVGNVTGASVGYTLKYISKSGKIPLHANDDRIPEFSCMSKGLGVNYCTEAMQRWHLDNLSERLYCLTDDGKKISMPRYYKQRMFKKEESTSAGQEALRNKLVRDQVQYEKDLELFGSHEAVERMRAERFKSKVNKLKIKSLKNEKL